MKRLVIAVFAFALLLLSSTVPAEARYHGGWGYGGWHGGYGGYGRSLGWGLAGLGLGLGLGALGAGAYYSNPYPYGYYNGYYNPYPVNVYTAPAYGYGGYPFY